MSNQILIFENIKGFKNISFLKITWPYHFSGDRGVTVIVVENLVGNPSSNFERGWSYLTWWNLGKVMNQTILLPSMGK